MEKVRKAISYIFAENEDFSLEDRLFLSSFIIGILTSLVGTLINLFIFTSTVAVILPSLLTVFLLVVFYYVRVKKMLDPFKIPLIIIALLSISVIWIFNGGINSSNSMPAFIVLIIGILVFPPKSKKYVIILFISLITIIYLIQFFYPEMIVGHQSETARWFDSLFTIIYSAYFIFLLINFIQSHYTAERRKSEESESKYRGLFENSPDAIAIYADGKIVNTNKECLSVMAASGAEELIGKPVIQFVHPDDRAMVAERMKTAATEGVVLPLAEEKFLRLDGSVVEVEVKAMPITLDNKPAVQLIVRDITERKRVEKALQESEQKHRILFLDSPDAYLIIVDGVFVDCNRATEVMMRGPRSQIIGQFPYVLSPEFQPDGKTSQQSAGEKIKEAILTGKNTFEWVHRRLDGTDMFVEVSIAVMVLDGKQALFTTWRDINERKSAEKELVKLRNAIEHSGEAVFMTDKEGIFTFINPGFTEIYGYTADEVIGKVSPRAIKSGVMTNEVYTIYWQSLLQGQEVKGEIKNKRKDGTIIDIEGSANAIYDENNTITGFLAIQRDITVRKHAEAIFKEIIEKNPISIQILDMEGYTLQTNSAHTKLFGVSPPPDYSIFNDDQLIKQGVVGLFELMKKGEVVYFPDSHFNVHDVDPSFPDVSVWIKAVGFPLNDNNGVPERLVLMHEDITERKIADKELMKAKEHAEESDRLKSAFLANMSHEIRTPMNGILGFAELLKMPDLTGEQQQEYIGIIKKSGNRMLNIINDIVDISKIESGQMKVTISETQLNPLSEFIFSFFKTETENKGIALSYKNGLSENESIISTDKEKLYAILTNLVKNAIKYSDKGSIEFGYILNGECLEYYVKDTGIGIPADRIHAIFDRFVQADIADTRAFQGAGLGLSISKAYVEMLGGTIWVESEEGKGAAFYFTIPYHAVGVQNPVTASVAPANELKEEVKKLKILIAEDDKYSELLITVALKDVSREILIVTNGAEAVEVCLKNPDLEVILMDIKMPVMDGYEATRQIRNFNKDVFIVAQTAYGLIGDREKALEAGCNEYMPKPLNIKFFKEMIQNNFK